MQNHISDWWLDVEDSILKYLEKSHKVKHLSLIEILDFNHSGILVYYKNNIFTPTKEFFKQFFKYETISFPITRVENVSPSEAIAIATAFPIYFRSWKFNSHALIDAGLVDNQGILARVIYIR